MSRKSHTLSSACSSADKAIYSSLTTVESCRDSAKPKQASFCSRCSKICFILHSSFLKVFLPVLLMLMFFSGCGLYKPYSRPADAAALMNDDDTLTLRWQELFTITIPSMGPQLLFAAVMQISASFTVGQVGQMLVGLPSTDYAAHTIMNHATDYGSIRYEMGYASAICFVLFMAMLLANKGVNWLLGKYLD